MLSAVVATIAPNAFVDVVVASDTVRHVFLACESVAYHNGATIEPSRLFFVVVNTNFVAWNLVLLSIGHCLPQSNG